MLRHLGLTRGSLTRDARDRRRDASALTGALAGIGARPAAGAGADPRHQPAIVQLDDDDADAARHAARRRSCADRSRRRSPRCWQDAARRAKMPCNRCGRIGDARALVLAAARTRRWPRRPPPRPIPWCGPASPFAFPRDHGAHPAFRTEWWYVTGWLRTGRATTGLPGHLLPHPAAGRYGQPQPLRREPGAVRACRACPTRRPAACSTASARRARGSAWPRRDDR